MYHAMRIPVRHSLVASFGVQPEISGQATRGRLRGASLDRVDRALRAERIGQRVVRVKVWNPKGRVVYSDDRRLVDKRFPISEELESALHGRIASEVSSLTEKEQADDRHFGRLLEVYVPLRARTGGAPVGAFEIYMPYAPIAARIARENREL